MLLSVPECSGYNWFVEYTEGKFDRRDCLALAILAAMIAAPFLARILCGVSSLSSPLVHDVGFQWIPFRTFIESSWEDGFFPLWCGGTFAGIPFAAFSHTGVFYPPGWLFLLGDYSETVNYFYPLQLFIAASGVFLLCRAIGLPLLGAFFAAVSYVFCGKPFYFIHFLPSTSSNVWIPWFLLAAVCFLQRGKSVWLVLTALFLALQVLGGDIESTAYSFFLSIPIIAVLMRGHSGWLRRVPALLLILVPAGFLCLVQLLPLYEYTHHFIRNQGVTYSYFTKNNLPPGLLWNLLFPVKGEITTNYTGPDKPYLYLGFMSFVLAVFAVIKRPRPSSPGLGVLALFALLWSFGSIPFLARFQYQFPFLNAMDFPELSFFMAQLLIAILAGQGLSYLLDGEKSPRRVCVYGSLIAGLCFLPRFIGPFIAEFFGASLLIAIACLMLPVVFLAAYKFRPARLGFLVAAGLLAVQTAELYGMAFHYLPSNGHGRYEYSPWLKEVSEKIDKTGHRYIMVSRKGLQDPELLYHTGIALGPDAIDGWITVPPRSYAELMALAAPRAAEFKDGKLDDMGINDKFRDGKFITRDGVPVLDLVSLGFIIDRGLNLKFASPYWLAWTGPYYHRRECLSGPFKMLADQKSIDEDRRSTTLLAGPGEVYRYQLHVREKDKLLFKPGAYRLVEDTPSRQGVFKVRVIYGATHKEIYKSRVESRSWPPLEKETDDEVEVSLEEFAGHTILLELENPAPEGCPGILHLWREARITNPDLTFQEAARPDTGVSVYVNREVLPRAFVVYDAEEAGEKVLARLSEANRQELRDKVFVDRLPSSTRRHLEKGRVAGKGSVVLTEKKPGLKKYRAVSSRPGLLFMSDQFYPGWRVFVEGEEVRLLQADHCFRAVPVQGGVNLVELRFEPVSFRIGLFGTLTGLLACLMFALFVVFRGRLFPGRFK